MDYLLEQFWVVAAVALDFAVATTLFLLLPDLFQLGDVGQEVLHSLSQVVSLAVHAKRSLEGAFAGALARVGVGFNVELEQLVCVTQEWLVAKLRVLLGQKGRGLGGLEDAAQHKRADGTNCEAHDSD